MLKKICGLFLGLVVLASSACVTPTHASSASPVIITSIQAAGPSGAKDESIVLYNQTDIPVNVTDWCLANKADRFMCFSRYQNDYPMQLTLPPHGYMTVVSEFYSQSTPILLSYATFIYGVTSQISGSLVGTADTVSLLTPEDEIIDTFSWTASAPTGKGWARTKISSAPDTYATANGSNDWGVVAWQNLPPSALISELPSFEEEPDPEDPNDPTEPTDPIEPGDSPDPSDPQYPDPAQPGAQLLPIIITELLANPVGSDTGNEFIELYNPNDVDIQLPATMRLRVGTDTPKWFPLPAVTISAKQYYVLYNSDIGFTLVNSNSAVALYDNDSPIGPSISYAVAKEGQSWALINGAWKDAKVPSPGSAAHLSTDPPESKNEPTQQKACAPDQFKNPETGRCKRIAAAATSPTPCKVGQERNPETNRCRNIVVAAAPAPCKPGQERSPETNRCRNVKAMTAVGFGVKGVQQKAGAQLQWYYLAAIGGIVLLILGYAVWEWRQELAVAGRHIKARFIKRHG